MFETLYKTNRPEELERAEYYQPRIDVERVSGRTVYFGSERHGWYSEAEKRAIHHTATFSPEEGFGTFEEAAKWYDQQIKHRASEGFVHSFLLDPFEGVQYRRIEV